MQEKSGICNQCPLKANKICHPNLKPEFFPKTLGFFVLSDAKPLRALPGFTYNACRHFSCENGRNRALIAMKSFVYERLIQRKQVHYLSGSSAGIRLVPFGTRGDKPEGRYVNVNGRIFSEQDGQIYETGQYAESYEP